MNVYTKQQVLDLLTNCDFTTLNCRNYREKVLDRLNFASGIMRWDVTHATGATKLVLIISNFDFVVKIPFSHDDYEEDDGTFCKWHGAKNPANNWDYCRTEAAIYREAAEWGLHDLFARTFRAGFVNHYPVYFQERVMTTGSGRYYHDVWTPGSITQEQREWVENHWCALSQGIMLALAEHYGYDFMHIFCYFVNSHRLIGDLHNGNFGITSNGEFRLIDYSGFRA